jgi:cyclopropane-fatty-acyl-phospholipid synthase
MVFSLPALITRPIGHGTDVLRGALGGMSWLPVLSLSKAAVTSLFSRIENGTLVVIDEATGKAEAYEQKIAKED